LPQLLDGDAPLAEVVHVPLALAPSAMEQTSHALPQEELQQ
jgi:hypothetical protein